VSVEFLDDVEAAALRRSGSSWKVEESADGNAEGRPPVIWQLQLPALLARSSGVPVFDGAGPTWETTGGTTLVVDDKSDDVPASPTIES